MKKPIAVIIIIGTIFVLAASVAVNSCSHQRQPAPRVSGALSTNDVAEIVKLVMRERAPLRGEMGPKTVLGWGWRLRERVSGEIRSITSINGQTANVDFRDRWDGRVGYDYDMVRTTNGWKVNGVGWRKAGKGIQ